MEVRKVSKSDVLSMKRIPLPERYEKNPWLILKKVGDGRLAPKNFNIRVFKNKQGSYTVTTTDWNLTKVLMQGGRPKDKSRVITVDDSNYGSYLGGLVIGIFDSYTQKVTSTILPTKIFKGDYQEDVKIAVNELLSGVGAHKENVTVKMCPSNVFDKALKDLRNQGFQVRIEKVTGALQKGLERRTREYLYELGYKGKIESKEMLAWIEKNDRWDIVKWTHTKH